MEATQKLEATQVLDFSSALDDEDGKTCSWGSDPSGEWFGVEELVHNNKE